MKGYLNNAEETAATLRTHKDGNVWLHTGDLGTMDEDGFIYYKQRLKRLIIVSGFNVYPSQVENTIDAHPDVLLSCAIGIPDPYKIHKVKAFVVLRPGVEPSEKIKEESLSIAARTFPNMQCPERLNSARSCPKPWLARLHTASLRKRKPQRQQQKKPQQRLNNIKQNRSIRWAVFSCLWAQYMFILIKNNGGENLCQNMFAISAVMNTTPKSAIPITALSRARHLRTFPRIGAARFAALERTAFQRHK
jgi:hypothetical protein